MEDTSAGQTRPVGVRLCDWHLMGQAYKAPALKYGQPCPYCGSDKVDYDSLLNLVCQSCGKTDTGACT
ncbi:MAG: hypothetical protein VB029_01090 [Anaerolineaceae bacterium]|nr:hypothetical protein [Anaerolineaceae bacterium]